MRGMFGLLIGVFLVSFGLTQSAEFRIVDDFNRPDMLYHGHGWETLNPGYWKIEDNALRRRLENVGDHNPATSFPWHWSTGGKKIEPRSKPRDPSLPMGMIWRRDWKLTGNYTIKAAITIRGLTPEAEEETDWEYNKPGYGMMGICFGGECLYESRQGGAKSGDGSWMACWRNDGKFGIYDHASKKDKTARENAVKTAPKPGVGDEAAVEVAVMGDDAETATVKATLTVESSSTVIECAGVDRKKFTDGYFGLVCRGLLDFEVNSVSINPMENQPLDILINELHVCYPLGDTLRKVAGEWQCKFIAMFRSEAETVKVRVADSPNPEGGWGNVPVAGLAKIVDNDFRRYTASIDVTLPISPAEKTLYYTVWKDGEDVTADPRSGYLGKKDYVGRLPQLRAPYRVCTLGGHALHRGGTTLPRAEKFQENWVHGQPTRDAYKYLEEYNFQIINWDDDVWYLELLFPPPSTDDAYKIITITLGNPTTRWSMMRHWNVIHPGDHDYGMDDVKGPEQILVRKFGDLGQDPEYMRRNFDIVRHIVTGKETRTGAENPKNWRRWKMPNGDFSIIVCEPRLWRSSQDTNIWVNGGWGHKSCLYDRTDPTRTLLGEEQFAWLQETIRTDTSPLILVTGINNMHTIFTGALVDPETGLRFHQEDRVAADYAGWVKAGADRVMELLGSRPGIVSVYGDIHLASITKNSRHRFYECSCGPIGRGGSRGLIKGFGPKMKDVDGRELEVIALYHNKYGSPDLKQRQGPPHWNFLEKNFDPRGPNPKLSIRIRNIIDPPGERLRGGAIVDTDISQTGRPISCRLPDIETLPNADVNFVTMDGRPIMGTRSLPDGRLPIHGLIDVEPGTQVMMTSFDGNKAEAKAIQIPAF